MFHYPVLVVFCDYAADAIIYVSFVLWIIQFDEDLEGVVIPIGCLPFNPGASVIIELPWQQEIELELGVTGNVLKYAGDFQVMLIVEADDFTHGIIGAVECFCR